MGFFKPFEMPTGANIPDWEVNIVDFGAVEGGEVKNTQAIANAIEAVACQGGGRVIFPAGTWLTGPIHFKSGVELHLEKGCEVLFSTNKKDYLPAVFTLYEGVRCYTYSAQLYAHECHDIAITGEGTFNGQGYAWWYWAGMELPGGQKVKEQAAALVPVEERVYDTEEQGLRPGLLHFLDCQNVLIEGCTFKFSPFWTLHPTWCDNIIIRNVTVLNPRHQAANTDGCNLEGCRRGLVDGIEITAADDALCLKSGRDEDGRIVGRPSEDIIIRNMLVHHSFGGITVGSEMSGGVSNIYVENCKFEKGFVGLWIKTTPERGGYVRDIEYHNIEAGRLWHQGICVTRGYYVDKFEDIVQPYMSDVENILIDNFSVEYANVGIQIEGVNGYPMRNIHLKNVSAQGKVNLQIAHVEGLRMENVKVAD